MKPVQKIAVGTPKEVRAALEARGYCPIALPALFAPGDVWYCHQKSTPEAQHFMRLEFKPMAKAYSVSVGVSNIAAREMLSREMSRLRTFMAPPLSLLNKFFDRPCWHLFDAGRALNWKSTYVVPDPKMREGWPILIEDLFSNFLEPVFFDIHDAAGVRALLSRADVPFEWFNTPAVMRAAEVMALGFVEGLDEDAIRSDIHRFHDHVSADLAPGRSFDEFVETFLALFAARSAS